MIMLFGQTVLFCCLHNLSICETVHCSLSDEGLDMQQFIDKWDAAHLAVLQANWDADDRDESEKGPRPTSYSS